MKPEGAIAQLSIVDGAWQESPDNVAIFDESALFEGGPERGSLCVVVELTGETEGRDALARELIETTRREYAASRGSISLALTQAVCAANDYFYSVNANTPREARRIAGMTAAILREGELFIAQAGPGMTCLVRGNELHRYPEESPWFDPNEAIGEFPTPGAVPIGLRRSYTPDLFHLTLQTGDTIVLSTRTLAHLLSNEELLDTLAQRHPDEIVTNLEDLTGAADLSVIAIQLAGDTSLPIPQPPSLSPLPPPSTAGLEEEEEDAEIRGVVVVPPAALTEEELALEKVRAEREQERKRVQAEKARERREKIRATFLRVTAGTVAAIAGVFGRVDWSRIGAAIERAISAALGGLVRVIIFVFSASLPGKPQEETPARGTATSKPRTPWYLAALLFPLLLVAIGGGMWAYSRVEQQRADAALVAQWIKDASAEIERAKRLAPTDRPAAREALTNAINLANKARERSPNNAEARTVYYKATDERDILDGVAVMLFLPSFATFADAKSNPSRIVARAPDVFVLDRGVARVHRYRIDDAGTTALPAAGDGVILKSGDKVDNRTVGELFDMAWIDAGRLVVLERSGLFLQYDPARSTWSARAASDGSLWARVNLLASYVGNLYLADPARNQILKYAASGDAWTSSTTYFNPGVAADLSNVVDVAIDGDVWLLRGDGSLFRYNAGRPNDIRLQGFEVPFASPTAIVTTPALSSVYIADAGNQRIVQFDKVTGRFTRQFKPGSQSRDAFKSLKTLAVDEPNRRFFWISGNQAYLATIPQ